MVTAIFIGHGIIPGILNRMVDFSHIPWYKEENLSILDPMVLMGIFGCFLVDKVTIKAIVLGKFG